MSLLARALSRALGSFTSPTLTFALRGMASSAPAAPPPKYHILQYNYVPDILEKRGPFRAGHIGAAQTAAAAGKLFVGGAFGDPPEGGMFIFKPDVPLSEIEAYVASDPYIKNGLVTGWSIKPFAVVAGHSSN